MSANPIDESITEAQSVAPEKDLSAALSSLESSLETASQFEKVTQEVLDLQTRVEALTKELEAEQLKRNENWDLYLRERADKENAKKRAQTDIDNARKFGLERFSREMLAVVDSLEHGLLATESDNIAAIKEGMSLTFKLLLDTLDKFGIRPINPVGQLFDPLRHEAISMQPSAELTPNSVMIVAQKGFSLEERVLRPARVIVSKKPDNPEN